MAQAPLEDPVAEARRLVEAAAERNLTVRALGGVAVVLQGPPDGLLLRREIRDIDLAMRRERWRDLVGLMSQYGYAADEMFNAVHGSRRLLFFDETNHRKLDVFVGGFSMCHVIPIADRLEKDALTIPLAELMLTKLQIVELTERDQTDVYNLAYHHADLEAAFIADLCARDWGLWRTAVGTIDQCLGAMSGRGLSDEAADVIGSRLGSLRATIDGAPKSARWKLRSRVGDRMRWYEEPEEHPDAGK